MSEKTSRRGFLQAGLGIALGASQADPLAAGKNPRALKNRLAAMDAPASVPGPQSRPWWERVPLRILDLGTWTSPGEVTERPPASLVAEKISWQFNAEHLQIMAMAGGLDDEGFFFSSRLAGKQNQDYLGEYLPVAKKRGLRVFIYFNVHWFKPSFGRWHPDWVQRCEDGQPLSGVYRTGTSFCVNTPWREWCFQILRDLCAYPIDGIFYDGPIFFPDTCYCRDCQEKFRKLYGADLPSKKQRQGKSARDLLAFQAQSLADFLHDSRAVIKAINPQIAFYMNGGERGGNWSTGRLNRVLVAEQDILGSEGGFIYGDLTRTPIWKPGVTARLLESQAPSKPRVIFSAAGHKPWTFSMLPEAELRLLYAESIANAANVWFGLTTFEFAQPEMQALAEMNDLFARHGSYFLDTKSEARVALVWSDTTANFYAGANAQLLEAERVPEQSQVGNLDGEFSGMTDALLRAQVPFDVLDDAALDQDSLHRYAAILLPNVACMSEQTAARLKDYAQQGGNLFATFETSLYDETGLRRANFALADVFGVSDTRKIVGPNRWDFMKTQASSRLLEGIAREFIPAPLYHVRVELRGGQGLLHFTKPLAGPYDGVPGLSDEPALIIHTVGKGRALYFSGDLGNTLYTFHMLEHLRLAANVVRELAPSPVVVENAPASLEVVMRSQHHGARILLHLINYTGEMTRPIRRVVPLENLRISVQVPEKMKKIHTLMHAQALEAKNIKKNWVELVVPRMNEYEVVVLEREVGGATNCHRHLDFDPRAFSARHGPNGSDKMRASSWGQVAARRVVSLEGTRAGLRD